MSGNPSDESAPKLTIKQERFCVAYIELGNATEAYCVAYDAENMARTTINRKAKVLLDNPKIQARLKLHVQEISITAHEVLKSIQRIAAKAEEQKRYGESLKGLELLGKHLQLFTDKQVVEGDFTISWEK